MKIVVDELISTLSQELIVTDEKRIIVNSIRPYLYMHNAPAGTFTLTLNDETGALVSKSFTSAEIKSDMETTDNYGYIYKTLIFDEKIQLTKKNYTLELSSSGYSFQMHSFLGWIREHDNIFNNTDGENNNIMENPLSFQIFNYRD